MPGGDRTGPLGAGPLTGRRAGYCAGFGAPGYANPLPGCGFGAGFGGGRGFGGGGRGWRNRYFATGVPGWARFGGAVAPQMTLEQESHALREQIGVLKSEMESLQQRLNELDATQGGKD